MVSWQNALKVYLKPNVLALFFLGFACGVPYFLIFSTLSFWQKEAGMSLAVIGFFALCRLPYSIKFLWAPFLDKVKLPWISAKLGRRRSWGILFQIGLIFSLLGLSMVKPVEQTSLMMVMAFLVAFFSASQDIVVDAWRIESVSVDEQAVANTVYTFGYRAAMFAAVAGALFMAENIPWAEVYRILPVTILVGMFAFLVVKEPNIPGEQKVPATLKEAVIMPLKDFLTRPHWLLILLFILFYKMGEVTLGIMANPFYLDVGFSKTEIAAIIKIYGVGATIAGGFIGGLLTVRYGVMKMLLLAGMLQAVSNLFYTVLAHLGANTDFLMLTITVDNLAAGFGGVVFIAYLSGLCNVAYTATQYALLSAIVMFSRDIIAAASGVVAEAVSWDIFFFLTFLSALPGLLLLVIIMKKIPLTEDKNAKR
ncbi:MAG: MFS transporter [Alphaproteobacteria bacterium]|nr:MFS transporter [Alphaproteobacteria bacterium]